MLIIVSPFSPCKASRCLCVVPKICWPHQSKCSINSLYRQIICSDVLTDDLIGSFQAKLETKALKAKRPGFTDERYHETSYYIENGK